jgi:hypothetical protein
VTFVNAIATLSDRFLTERAFDLIVGPALADFQYDDHPGLSHYAGVIAAFAGAFWDDAVRGGGLWTFAAMVLIPMAYYAFLFLLWLPAGFHRVGITELAVLGGGVGLLSLAPAIACCWPDRDPRQSSPEN